MELELQLELERELELPFARLICSINFEVEPLNLWASEPLSRWTAGSLIRFRCLGGRLAAR